MEAELKPSETLETKPDDAALAAATIEQPGNDAITPEVGSGTEAAGSVVAEPEQKHWLTDEYRELASSYGFKDEDLGDFTSPEEFKRATRLIDKQFVQSVEAQRQAYQAQQAAEQQRQQEQQTQSPKKAASEATTSKSKLTKLDLEKMKEEGWGESELNAWKNQNDLIDEMESLRNQLAEQQALVTQTHQGHTQLQQVIAQNERARWLNTFHSAVDSLGDGRFGKTIGADGKPANLSRQENEARQRLHDMAETLAMGIATQAQARGQQPNMPPLQTLLRRAEQVVFADDIARDAVKKSQAAIAEQAKRRRPVASIRASNGQYAGNRREPMTINDRIQEVANNPEVVKAWKILEEKSGVAAG